MPPFKDLTDKTFYDLTVLYKAGSTRSGNYTWLCQCNCGVEKVVSSDHLTRKKNPVKSCGCKRVVSGPRHHQWEGYGEISGSWWYNHIKRELFGKNNRFRIEVTLTIEEAWELFLRQDRKCALSGLELGFEIDPYGTASLDRIDSSKGYILENVQWVHKDINFMKRTYSQEYFIEMCNKVAQTNL